MMQRKTIKLKIGIQGLLVGGAAITILFFSGSKFFTAFFGLVTLGLAIYSIRSIAEFSFKRITLYPLFREKQVFSWDDVRSIGSSPYSSSTILNLKNGSVILLVGMLHRSYHKVLGEIVETLERKKLGAVVDSETRKIIQRGTYIQRFKRFFGFNEKKIKPHL